MLSKSWFSLIAAYVCAVVCGAAVSVRADDWKIIVSPDNSFVFNVLHNDHSVLTPGTGGWGPNWSWFYLGTRDKGAGDEFKISADMAIGSEKAKIGLNVKPSGSNSAVFEYQLNADTSVPVVAIVATLGIPARETASVVLTKTDNSVVNAQLPVKTADFGTVNKIDVTSADWTGPVTITLDPPVVVSGDGDLRFKMATDAIKAGTTKETITYTFPDACTLLLRQSDIEKLSPVVPQSDWFAYQPKWSGGSSAIGCEDWMDKPAGQHGGVRLKGDQFVFEDGKAAKFWGVSIGYSSMAPEKSRADFTAARFGKYGVNAVRLHNFTGSDGWDGIGDPNDATQMTAAGMDKMDYFTSKLAENGVYYGWSSIFQLKVRPGNKARLSGYDELMAKGGGTYAVANWAEDVQDVLIDSIVNMLKHKNTYTGKTYAEDPALCYIQCQNEDDIFFWTTPDALKNYPTYRKQLEAHFAEWLTTRYGTQQALASAWGDGLENDSLTNGAVAVHADTWLMTSGALSGFRGGKRQRILDTAAFLHHTQDKFYAKFAKAIRDAGYNGPLVGSPWQAPAMLPHYYNLQSDATVGYVDRHDYFGGGFSDTMMKSPGGGFLSMGLQQVAGRPMGTSEWIDVYPSLYSAEGPVLMAAYGMGLQGWGSSYEYQSDSAIIDSASAIVGKLPWGVWNADVPTQLGQYPILHRMIMRGDVTTGPVISTRRVSKDDLANGTFNFSDIIDQQGDVKTFSGSVPAESLAAGRDLVEFTDKTAPSDLPDMSKYTQGKVITSNTGQLKWDAGSGVVTINTPGTQGYVGFAADQILALNDITIAPRTKYASILVTAANRQSNLSNDTRVLISAVARNSNTGFRIFTIDDHTILDNGKGPILLEPVKADITFTKRQIKQVNILDQDGNESSRTLPVSESKFTIDGTRDHALYYEVLLDK